MRGYSWSPLVHRCLALAAALAPTIAPAVSPAMDLVDVVARIEKSVVRIDTNRSLGSGVIVDDAGLVITNFHVIEGASRATIVLRSGKSFVSSGYLAIDPSHDLALLKTDPFEKGAAVKRAEGMPRVGEKVAAFGCPQGFSFTTSEGIVSAIRSGRELTGILGERGNRWAADATWIQTTAPISPGNSGGPLVTMDAALVGLNTMCYTDGQNLNFAMSLTDINRLLKDSATIEVPTPLDRMPTERAVPSPPPPGSKQPEFQLALPTGRVFSFGMFTINPRAFNQFSKTSKDDIVKIAHPSGTLFAVAGQQDGLLNGATIAQWENEQPMVYATYLNGKRHGILRTWNEAGQPMFCGQYTQGRRHGFCCFFEDGELRLLTQYKADQVQWVQLMAGFEALEGFDSREKAENNSDARDLLKKQEAYETTLKVNEVTFRKSVSDFKKAHQREMAAQLGVEKRQRARERAAERAAHDNAVHNALWQRFLGK